MTDEQLKTLLEAAAEAGAKKALASVGLHDEGAPNDVRDLRQLLADWRTMRRSVLTTIVNSIVFGIVGLAVAGAVWHLRRQ